MRISKKLLKTLCKRNNWCDIATDEQYAKLEGLATVGFQCCQNPTPHELAICIVLLTGRVDGGMVEDVERKLKVFA